MRKKNIIISLFIFLLFILLIVVNLTAVQKNSNKVNEVDYTNRLFQYGGKSDSANRESFIFMKNGTYIHFTTQYYEECDIRAKIGTWEKNDNSVYVKYKYATYFDGGDIIETDDTAYFGKRRINYNVVKRKYEYTENINYNIIKYNNSEYNMKIGNNYYYPVYEFETEEELYKKLEEMYGEVFTMLIDDSVEVQ